jgi:lantibiotic modifying enzyme
MRSERGAFLDAAGEFAHGIAASAVWCGDRCNWLGTRSGDDARGGRVVASLEPDVYGGTAGVALFLAEAATKLDDDELRAAALGAIRHSLDHARRIRPEHRDGLYLGWIGVAYAAARVASVLDSAPVRAGAGELLEAWRRDATRSPSSDLMSGCAGAVVGLLALAPLVDAPWLVAAARQLGDEVVKRARTAPVGWSWGQPGQRSMHHLCGISHGAAGIGLALAELSAVAGDLRFGHAAERAFDYERSWFDPLAATWPDLRGVGRSAGRDIPLPTAESWCNGAGGIALSRLRAAALLGSVALSEDAEHAFAACERHGFELLARAPRDFSLCHGAAGTGDVLLQAAAGPEDPRGRLAAEIGLRGLADLERGAAGLPCGLRHGTTPGLLLGDAGIGMFYLRLFDAEIASVLLVCGRSLDSRFHASVESAHPARRVP